MELPDFTSIKALLEYFKTVPIQAGLFLGILFVLNKLVFAPFLKIIEERRRKTIETFKNAEQVSHQTQNISLEYEKKIKDHKDHLRKKMDETRRELEKEQAEKLHKTKTELLKNMQEKHQKIKETVVQVEKELSQDIKGLSSEIVQKFLGVA